MFLFDLVDACPDYSAVISSQCKSQIYHHFLLAHFQSSDTVRYIHLTR